jgi:hypothetical protein
MLPTTCSAVFSNCKVILEVGEVELPLITAQQMHNKHLLCHDDCQCTAIMMNGEIPAVPIPAPSIALPDLCFHSTLAVLWTQPLEDRLNQLWLCQIFSLPVFCLLYDKGAKASCLVWQKST